MGKGIFSVENRFFQFMNKVTDIVLLSVLMLVFSIPLITAGAAMSGFYYGAMRINEDKGSGIWSDFWYGFRKSVKVSTVIWLMQLVLLTVLLMNMWVSLQMNTAFSIVIMIANGVLLLVVLLMALYAYAIAARYQFGITKIIRDSVMIALGYLPHSAALLVLAGGCIFLATKISYIWLFIPAMVGYQAARVNVWIFHKFEVFEDGEEETDDDWVCEET